MTALAIGMLLLAGFSFWAAICWSDSASANVFAELGGIAASVSVAILLVQRFIDRERGNRLRGARWTLAEGALDVLEELGGKLAFHRGRRDRTPVKLPVVFPWRPGQPH